jgi:hypothetical protein
LVLLSIVGKELVVNIRQLDAGAAWNEAERRAIPFGFVGFFLAGLVCAFGHDPGIRDPFLAGICGAVGLFLADIAFLVGFYRKKLALALIAALLVAPLPTAITAFLLSWIGKGKIAFVPSFVVGVGLYMLLHRIHRTLSGMTLLGYVRQLAYDPHATPKTQWERAVFLLLAGLGTIVILALLIKK